MFTRHGGSREVVGQGCRCVREREAGAELSVGADVETGRAVRAVEPGEFPGGVAVSGNGQGVGEVRCGLAGEDGDRLQVRPGDGVLRSATVPCCSGRLMGPRRIAAEPAQRCTVRPTSYTV